MRTSGAVLALVTAVHLVAQLLDPEGPVADATQPLLMPALAAVLLTGTSVPRSRLVRITLLALFFSWLGDTLPRLASGDAGFLVMVGCFLLAQVAYVVAFWPLRGQSLLARPVLRHPVRRRARGAGRACAAVVRARCSRRWSSTASHWRRWPSWRRVSAGSPESVVRCSWSRTR